MIKKEKLVEQTKYYSFKAHKKINHKYGNNLEYSYHLNMVFKYGKKFIHLIKENDRPYALSGCFAHDRLEDCYEESYNDLKKWYGVELAEIVYLVTDEKGRTRDERKPKKLYDEMLYNMNAVYVKLCDRLANIEYSKTQYDENPKNKMYLKYLNEQDNFKKKLYLSSNLIEQFNTVGIKETLKTFKYYPVLEIIKNTLINKKSCKFQEIWDFFQTEFD